MSDKANIISLAAKAKEQGIDSVEAVTGRLEEIIESNKNYLALRKRRGVRTLYDNFVESNQTVLAMAIVLLESLQQQ